MPFDEPGQSAGPDSSEERFSYIQLKDQMLFLPRNTASPAGAFLRMRTPLRGILSLVAYFLFFGWLGVSCVNSEISRPRPLFPDDPKGTLLPRGVPRVVDAYGNVIAIPHRFTTPEYNQAASKLLLDEANRVAREMRLLDEKLPITKTNAIGETVLPFGYAYIHKSIGVVCTSNYVYMVCAGDKFSGLDVADYDQVCLKLSKSSVLPISEMDTNGFAKAYQLATQWLSEASMDVRGLNRDCKHHIALSAYWNGLTGLGQMPRRTFVPIYYVWWTSPGNDAQGSGGVARVELFLPTKKLIQMSVDDPRYILRKPLVFKNLASLFPGSGRVTVLRGETGPLFRPSK